MILLFDAANTLIHKPSLFPKLKDVLNKHGFDADLPFIQHQHKIVSELIHFPDRTSRTFYEDFNREFLYALGIIPDIAILEDIFSECSYLPWEKFDDTAYLADSKVKMAVLSNFHGGLTDIMSDLFPGQFSELIISEKENSRKPDQKFYLRAIEQLGVQPADIVYIGDSVKLDLEPALALGMDAWIIDRYNFYPSLKRKISSLREINKLV
jgi:putative hydrolase of the HAD superfamily